MTLDALRICSRWAKVGNRAVLARRWAVEKGEGRAPKIHLLSNRRRGQAHRLALPPPSDSGLMKDIWINISTKLARHSTMSSADEKKSVFFFLGEGLFLGAVCSSVGVFISCAVPGIVSALVLHC